MLSKTITLFILLVYLCGCSSNKDLKAPCSYGNRSGCGEIIPLQQSL